MNIVIPNLTPAERCRAVADHIEAEPEHFDMSNFFSIPGSLTFDSITRILYEGERPCGTTACIAGWAILLTPPVEIRWTRGIEGAAAELLSLTREESGRLFFQLSLTNEEAAYLLRLHANKLDFG